MVTKRLLTYRQQIFTWPPTSDEVQGPSRWQEKRTCLLLSSRNKNLSQKSLRLASVWTEGGLMDSELQGWPDKGAPHLFSSRVGRWARRKQEESPTKVFVTNQPVPFLPSSLPHSQKSLPAIGLPALETGSDKLTARQLTARIQDGRPGRQYLCEF